MLEMTGIFFFCFFCSVFFLSRIFDHLLSILQPFLQDGIYGATVADPNSQTIARQLSDEGPSARDLRGWIHSRSLF